MYASFYQQPADAGELIARLGLGDRRDASFGKLSGGHRHRGPAGPRQPHRSAPVGPGGVAKAVTRACSLRPDVVLMDLRMPDVDGVTRSSG